MKTLKVWETDFDSPEKLLSLKRFDEAGLLTESCAYDKDMLASCTTWERGEDTFIKIERARKAPDYSNPRSYTREGAFDLELSHHPVDTERQNPDGRVEVFDSFGDIVQIRQRGSVLRMTYSQPGLVTKLDRSSAEK